jgi:signal peptidase I
MTDPTPSSPPDPTEETLRARSRADLVREVRRLIRDFSLALLFCILAIAFLVQPFKVEGTSMEPRLSADERILVNKMVYRVWPVERGDVVVFWFPGDQGRSFIKRIIGLPGDEVEIRSGQVLLNGALLEEPYVPTMFRARDDFGPVRVPDGVFFVLGDHRSVSNDSRSWGMVPEHLIHGKAFLRYWPFSRMGVIQ